MCSWFIIETVTKRGSPHHTFYYLEQLPGTQPVIPYLQE